MNSCFPLPDPHLVQALAILDVLETALVAGVQSVAADYPAALLPDLAPADPTVGDEMAHLLCSTAQSLIALLRDYRLALLDSHLS